MNMNKVLVKLYVPKLEEEYYIWLPINKKTYKVIKLLVKVVYELSGGYYRPNTMPMLYDRTTDKRLDINISVKENDIRNGTEIVMI